MLSAATATSGSSAALEVVVVVAVTKEGGGGGGGQARRCQDRRCCCCQRNDRKPTATLPLKVKCSVIADVCARVRVCAGLNPCASTPALKVKGLSEPRMLRHSSSSCQDACEYVRMCVRAYVCARVRVGAAGDDAWVSGLGSVVFGVGALGFRV